MTSVSEEQERREVNRYENREKEIALPQFNHDNEPMSMFLYGIRAEETRRQHTSKLRMFFDFLAPDGENLDEQSRQFISRAAANGQWVATSIIRFINFQKERLARKEISEATLRNYLKPIKLFCEMNDIHTSYKKK